MQLCIHGSDAKKLFAYSPDTSKDTKQSISRLIIVVQDGAGFLYKMVGLGQKSISCNCIVKEWPMGEVGSYEGPWEEPCIPLFVLFLDASLHTNEAMYLHIYVTTYVILISMFLNKTSLSLYSVYIYMYVYKLDYISAHPRPQMGRVEAYPQI